MLMVIFGAGASHGSTPPNVHPMGASRPPVTADLFSPGYGTFASKYPSSRPAIVRLRKAQAERPDALIEAEIGKLFSEAPNNPERARHLLALRFYLNDVIGSVAKAWWDAFDGFTFYGELLERLGVWRSTSGDEIALVTFNYDQMLDWSAAGQVGNWDLGEFPSYVERPDWRLYKLHGSTGWSRVVRATTQVEHGDSEGVIREGAALDFEEGELRARPWKAAMPVREVGLAAPGIAVPTNLKQTFTCPQTHIERFTADVGEVSRMIIVGWRASEPHALELLEHVPRGYDLAICDLDDDTMSEVRSNMGMVADRARTIVSVPGGFASLLEGNWLEEWLQRPSLP
jgi:hypothetical protein